MSLNPIQVEDRWIGPGHPCFLVAEVGINHNGSLDLAHEAIDSAVGAGASAVKFQNYHTEDFIFDRSLTYEYISQGRRIVESQYDMFKRYELPGAAFRDLRQYCERSGVIFFSTPSSTSGVEELVRLGTPLLKNGSDYLVHLPLIRAMGRTGLPTVLSTGMATRNEIQDAVAAFRDADGKDLLLLQCTSAYPTRDEDVNLRKIPALREAFGCLVGFSDHTKGIIAALGAVALGACVIEKHFTLDKNLPGPDHGFSADPSEFRALVDAVRIMERNLGTPELEPACSEDLGRRDYRLSCVASRALATGHRLTNSDIAFHRPGSGFPPKQCDSLLNRALGKSISPGHVFAPEDFA